MTARLRSLGFTGLITRSRGELDLENQQAVAEFFNKEKPEYVVLAAAKVGGIKYNSSFPADFIYSNLAIAVNVIHSAYKNGVKRLIFFGSSCMYPKIAPQPMAEELILTGPVEPTSLPYAMAKIAGVKMCEAYNRQYITEFLPVLPANLYGPHDNFNPEHSHVLPALILRMHQAKISGSRGITIWGSGAPRREFLFVEDLVDAFLMLLDMEGYTELTNIGAGTDVAIRELCEIISGVVGYKGALHFDASKPDGAPRKLLNSSKISSLGWKPRIPLERGIELTYNWFLRGRNTVPGG